MDLGEPGTIGGIGECRPAEHEHRGVPVELPAAPLRDLQRDLGRHLQLGVFQALHLRSLGTGRWCHGDEAIEIAVGQGTFGDELDIGPIVHIHDVAMSNALEIDAN